MTTIPSWCHRGAKVECVLAPRLELVEMYPSVTWPVVGSAYTIRTIYIDPRLILVLLEEIENHHLKRISGPGKEPPFPLFMFRPLVQRDLDADLAHFKHLIDGVPA